MSNVSLLGRQRELEASYQTHEMDVGQRPLEPRAAPIRVGNAEDEGDSPRRNWSPCGCMAHLGHENG